MKTRRVGIILVAAMIALAGGVQAGAEMDLYQQAGLALRRAVDAFAAPAIARGIVDIELMKDANVNWEMARPVTYARIFLAAYHATHSPKYLGYVRTMADFLVAAKQPCGGYSYWTYIRRLGSDETKPRSVTFRDGHDLNAVKILLEVYDITGDRKYLDSAIETADFVLKAQYDCGAWPSSWPPPKGSWLALPMFNDLVTISQTRLLMLMYKYTGDERYLEGVKKAGQFMIDWQLPEPTPGWAQQYNWDKTPAWGRVFEPPSVCGLASAQVVNLLMDIYLLTGEEKYLGPIPAALAWLERSKTGPHEWARFYEPGTGKPIYAASHERRDIRYDRKVLYKGYAQWGNWGIEEFSARWQRLQKLGREGLLAAESAQPGPEQLRAQVLALEPVVKELIADSGFIGRYPKEGGSPARLLSAVRQLSRYLQAVRKLAEVEAR